MNLLSLIQPLEDAIKEATSSELPELVGVFERLKAQAWSKLTMPSNGGSTRPPEPQGRMLTVSEASEIFHVSDRWLYRHKKHMPHSQPSRKILLFPEEPLRRWFASRK